MPAHNILVFMVISQSRKSDGKNGKRITQEAAQSKYKRPDWIERERAEKT